MSDESPVWMISGCSTGFGRELGRTVIARGDRVALTARDPSSLAGLVADSGGRAVAIRLDVTDGDQIAAAGAAAEARFGRIDVLVNNAGYGYASIVELAEEAEIRALFETNFFGVVRLTTAVLPGMRRRGRGHVFNMGSIAGVVSGASSGFYSASKHAVEAFTEALAAECVGFGVKATVIEPGTFATDFATRSLRGAPVTIADYLAPVAAFWAQSDALVPDRRPGDPARGAAAIVEWALRDGAPLRLPLGMDAVPRMARALTERLAELDRWRGVADAAAFPPT